jgi:hypothetical protein
MVKKTPYMHIISSDNSGLDDSAAYVPMAVDKLDAGRWNTGMCIARKTMVRRRAVFDAACAPDVEGLRAPSTTKCAPLGCDRNTFFGRRGHLFFG